MGKRLSFVVTVFLVFWAVFVLRKAAFLLFYPEFREGLLGLGAARLLGTDVLLALALTLFPGCCSWFGAMRFGSFKPVLHVYFLLVSLAVGLSFVAAGIPGGGVLPQLSFLILFAALLLFVLWDRTLSVFEPEMRAGK